MRTYLLAVLFAIAACTDFQFEADLICSADGTCPDGFFCDESVNVCRVDLATCGNGTVDPGEVCDDGLRVSGDGGGCRADCLKSEICGDGVKDPQEACDDGPGNGDTAACLTTCVSATCGDGHVQAGVEDCDDANDVDTDSCLQTCKSSSCGDGFIQAGEQCDDGAANSDTAACLSTCVMATCGDGHVQAGVEQCDDANAVDTDSCLANCRTPTCGDGAVQVGVELCDDGNASNVDACNSSCRPSEVVQVVAGSLHTCALRASGTVRCWGSGANGRLGYANTNNIGDNEDPIAAGNVTVGGKVTQLAAGASHTCALLDTGKVRCWGDGSAGQLGYGNTNSVGDNESPASVGDVSVGGTVVQITAGGNHTCAVLATGNVRCWGDGSSGQLGYGNTNTIGASVTPASAGDVPVGGTVVQIAAGGAHTCAVLDTGNVRCWGAGGSGQLGYGNTNAIGDNETPAGTGDVPIGGTVVQITTGSTHTCARLDTGNVRCWGFGAFGQLGYGDTNNIGDNEAAGSAGDVDVGGTVVQITAGGSPGGSHTCALLDTGKVRCWGSGAAGQLGYGNTNNIGDNEPAANAGDINVGSTVVQITAGGFHSCALIASGSVRCWGNGALGRLGYGNTTTIGDNEAPNTAGDAHVGGSVVQIVAGEQHTCVLLDTGNVRCWGLGNIGQLGYGNTNSVGTAPTNTPAIVGNVPIGGTVVQLAAGARHTCALLSTGNVRCWGDGSSGQLGYGNTNSIGATNGNTPAVAGDISVGGTVVQITAGNAHTCALLDTQKVRCWGDGLSGKLGYGNTTTIGDTETPDTAGDVAVGGNVIEVVAGGSHTCARLDTGTVRCWGAGGSGALGYGNTNDIGDNELPSTAGNVSVGGTVVQITVGFNHTCARLDTGTVRCWGENSSGQLGYGNTNNIGDNETPTAAGNVAVGGTVAQIAGGGAHTCARLTTGSVRCWGSGGSGRLGYGNSNFIGDNELPSTAGDVVVGGVSAQIATGGVQTCVVLENGNVRCWGFGPQGQLGYGNTNNVGETNTPTTAGDVPVF